MANFPFVVGDSLRIGDATLSATGNVLSLPSGTQVGSTPVATTTEVSTGGGPKITNLQITDNSWAVLDDTAVDTAGGYILITGTNFVSGALVYFNQTPATSVAFVGATSLQVTVPALTAGTYVVYVINPDGGTAIRVPGLTASANPAWQTGSALPDQYDGVAITLNLVATDATSYTITSGSLPPGLSLNTSTGAITGTVTGVTVDTTYTFTVLATDAELQDSPRTFTVTITVSDPYFKLTTLLLSGSAISADTVIRDSSTNNFNLTAAGDARASNRTPYGTGWSVYFDGTGDYLSFTNSNNQITFGTDNFTIESWVNFTNPASTSSYEVVFRNYTTDPFTTDYFYLGKHPSATVSGAMSFWLANYAGNLMLSDPTLPTAGWIHYAVVRNSNTWTLYRNGLAVHTVTSSVSMGTRNNNTCQIGVDLNGHISNLRVVKGTAVYTANFTPATTNLTSVANTSLLTCHVNSFRDASTNNFAITRNGDAAVRSFNPFGITNTGVNGSAYFDGTGDYIDIASNAYWNFGDGTDFTIELWAYTNNLATQYIIWSNAGTNSSGYNNAYIYTNGTIGIGKAGVNEIISATSTWVSTQWNHLAFVRNGSNLTIFYNGVSVASTASASTYLNNATAALSIGRNYQTSVAYFTGYISNYRVVKGTAVYTANFTPPTSPLTAIANTQLLTLQYDQPHNNHTFLDSSSNQFVVTRNGNATQGTFSPFSQTRWGNYFDGTNDYLSIADNTALELGSSNFLIEAFIYLNALPTTSAFTICSKWNTSNYEFNFQINNYSGSYYFEFIYSINGSTSPGAPAAQIYPVANTWMHVAVSRTDGNIYYFVNGAQVGTTQSFTATMFSGSANFNIARTGDGYNYLNGYISNFRLIKGAGYSTISVPTAPLTSIPNTQLLTCQSNRFIDNSPNNFTVTPTNGPLVVAFSPFAPTAVYNPAVHGGSAYFDGTGDYLTVGSASDWTFMHNGLVSWTLSGVIYRNSATDMQLFSTNANSVTGYQGMNVFIGSAGVIGASYTAGTNGYRLECTSNTSGLFPVGAWTTFSLSFNHLAAQGSRYSAVVNGTSYTSFTEQTIVNNANNAATFVFSTAAPLFTAHIGSFIGSISGTGNFINGYLTNYKIVTGATTVIELKFTDAAILDSTGRNVLETVADAKTSSVVTKFTGGSMSFDGTGDRLATVFSPLQDLSIGNWTIEFWLNLGATIPTTYRSICGASNGGGNLPKWAMIMNANTGYTYQANRLMFATYNGADRQINVAVTWASNTWYHIAVVHNNGTTALYLDGSSQGTIAFNIASGITGAIRIGADGEGYSDFTGYISDFRITRGYARYTANFTAPTAPARLK